MLYIFSIGKNKTPEILSLEQEYLKRLTRWTKIQQQEFKTEDKLINYLKQNNFFVVGLEETGKQFNTRDFSKWLEKTKSNQAVAFILADEAGFSSNLEQKFNFTLSLSPLTFPHELARLLLCEQLYRSFSLLNHHPYHK